MGRGRGKGKGKTQYAIGDVGSGEDKKLPTRRRGRPLKPMKDVIDVEMEDEKIEQDDDGGDGVNINLSKSSKSQAGADSSRKRKRYSLIKENAEVGTEENDMGTKNNAAILIKSISYRPNGSRRKNKPRRAAEVGIKCK